MQKSEEENDQIFIYYTYGLKKYTSGTPTLADARYIHCLP